MKSKEKKNIKKSRRERERVRRKKIRACEMQGQACVFQVFIGRGGSKRLPKAVGDSLHAAVA